MDDELYDEFGNYIGPELASSEDEEASGDEGGAWDDPADNRQHGGGGGGGNPEDNDPYQFGDGGASSSSAAAAAAAAAATDGMDDGGGGDDSGGLAENADDGSNNNAIVLHEDKQFYPDASEVYPDAETLLMEEDAQGIEEPIIAPVRSKTFSKLEREVPGTTYSTEFMTALMGTPSLIRSVAVLGALGHGKTRLLDMLVEQTHDDRGKAPNWDPAKARRYTDARVDEQERALSIKATPVSLVLPAGATGKSHLINLIDCPGHVCFGDEATAGLRASDGCVLVVDAVEGVMLGTERSLRHAVRAGAAVTLCINKVDRLILELKLPPADAYYKLQHTIDEVNGLLSSCADGSAAEGGGMGGGGLGGAPQRVSPELGNVVFAAAAHGWSFTLESFARVYCARTFASGGGGGNGGNGNGGGSNSGEGAAATAAATAAETAGQSEAGGRRLGQARAPRGGGGSAVDPVRFAKRLWGAHFYDGATRQFGRKAADVSSPRSFVQFVLEPLYKIYALVLGEPGPRLGSTLRSLGVRLRREQVRTLTK